MHHLTLCMIVLAPRIISTWKSSLKNTLLAAVCLTPLQTWRIQSSVLVRSSHNDGFAPKFTLPSQVSSVRSLSLSFRLSNSIPLSPGLPYAIRQAGFMTGLLLLVIICGLTDWTIRLIVRNAKLSGRSSYIDVMDHVFGASGRAAVSLFQFSFAFGGAYHLSQHSDRHLSYRPSE
jgi:Amino acid permeases